MHYCEICALHKNLEAKKKYEVLRFKHWVLRHHPEPAPLQGWLMLDSLRHISGAIDFDKEEASQWGIAVKFASQLIKQLTNCDRVYAIAFGEASHHLHLHLIPRFQSNPKTAGWSIADYYRDVALHRGIALEEGLVEAFVKKARLLSPSIDFCPKGDN